MLPLRCDRSIDLDAEPCLGWVAVLAAPAG